MDGLSQQEIDAKALDMVAEIIQLGRAGKPYRHLLEIARNWIAMSPETQRIVKNISSG